MKKESETKPKNEAEAFTDLTRRLLSVPKRDIDKIKAKYENAKHQTSKKRAT